MKTGWMLAAAVPASIVLLTWLSLRALNPNAERYDVVLSEMDRFAAVQARLHRDVLAERTGTLRNYDPLVHEVNDAAASLVRLRAALAQDSAASVLVDRLTAADAREEDLVEQFKSDNALLQNALAYFGLFASRIAGGGQSGPLAPLVATLAAAMLHFTLDTSPDAAHDVQDRLNAVAAQPVPAGDPRSVEALLAHGWLLRRLLPAVDETLRAISALPPREDSEALRAVVLGHQSESRAIARRFRVGLYIISLLLVAGLVRLGLQLRAGARALRHRATFEHVIAELSMRFVASDGSDLDRDIRAALGEIAACAGSDRAYFLLSGPHARTCVWHRPGAPFPPGWPDRAPALAARLGGATGEAAFVPSVAELPRGDAKDVCRDAGLLAWAYVSAAGPDGTRALLGLDTLRGSGGIMWPADAVILRMALDSIRSAVARQSLEHDKARLEARLQQARRMETVGAFASGIAHNFNNILGAILGYAELAEEYAGSIGAPPYVAEIRRAAERARALVEQIMAFGRPRDARRRAVQVASLIAEAASLLRAALPPGIELRLQPPPESVAVSGEHAQLQQVLLNLGTNAAQAMDGTGCVEIAVQVHEVTQARSLSHGALTPGRYVCIAVVDAGRGIDEATLPRVFEPFFTTRATGNGLGLATVREIVREHGGAMHVASVPGQGTRFETWLPCIAAAGSMPDRPATPALGRGETVLLIDAERDWRLRHEEMLAALGYEPVGFGSADAALAASRQDPARFDLVLLARVAPPASKTEIAARLHRILPTTPILLATASTDGIDADALAECGAADVLRWPFHVAELAAALERSSATVLSR